MPNHRREFLTALTASAAAALAPKIASAQQTPATKPTTTKEVVTGIGGFFYRAHDPRALEQWYHEHLGIPHNTPDPHRPGVAPAGRPDSLLRLLRDHKVLRCDQAVHDQLSRE